MTVEYLKKAPLHSRSDAGETRDIVGKILDEIEAGGDEKALEYAAKFDNYQGAILLSAEAIKTASALVPDKMKRDIEFAHANVKKFAEVQKSTVADFETEVVPGLIAGQKAIPVNAAGCYIPGGRYSHIASAIMTVTTAKVAGCKNIIACSPPRPDIGVAPAIIYAAHISGADKILAMGGVQGVAAMTFGLFGLPKANILVGPGNQFVAEAKRMLFGRIGIDMIIGALLCEKLGILNLGIEGIFVAGAMVGWMSVWLGAGLWGGVLAAAIAGSILGLLHGILTVPLGLSQHVSGLAITLFASSLSYFSYRTALPTVSSPPRITPFQPLDIPVLSDLPFLGPVLFQQTSLTFFALFCVILIWYVLEKTALGVAIKAVGDNPNSVDAQGLSVYGLRIGAVMAGSALMALGGAFLTMSAFDAFFFGMVNGRGWICIALVIFASWRPGKALFGAILFGAFDALQVRLQTEVGAFVPSQVFLAAPYILSIFALVIAARSADYPRALLKPWFKGQR